MSDPDGNGTPRRPRTPSHEPTVAGTADRTEGADEGPQGILGPPSSPVLDGRNPRGRFEAGNTLGRGHVVNRKVSEMRRVALSVETPEQVAGVIARMRELAMEGDTTAARIYIETMIGKPVQGVEITGRDGEAIGQDGGAIFAALSAALGGFPDDVRFAVIGAMKGAVDARRAE